METIKTKTVLTGKEWRDYLDKKEFKTLTQMNLYRTTYKWRAIYQIGEYYFTFGSTKGYKNITRLKALIK